MKWLDWASPARLLKMRRGPGLHFAMVNAVGSVDVIDRMSVLCFAGTYGLALLAELSRFFVRSTLRVRRGWLDGVGLAGSDRVLGQPGL